MSSSSCSSAILRNQQSIISKTISTSLKFLLSGSLSLLPLLCQGLISKASAAGTTYFYVATNGSDTAPGTSTQPFKTVQKAATAVRSVNKNMTGDIVVLLKGGTYQLNRPLTLSPEDSGTNGYNIIYKAEPGAKVTLSGGRRLGRWSLFDGSKNIYRVWFGKTTYPREFYNGELRATRARGLDDPTGFTRTETGYTTTDLNLQNWKNVSDVEIVSTNFFKSFRCGVSGIIGGNITMKQPCWNNSLQLPTQQARPILNPSWMENAYELLDTHGEWYYNKTDGYIYYKPHPYENLSKAEAVAPVLDKLIVGSGKVDNPVHNIIFQDLNFKYGTWYYPNSSDGYASLGAGFYVETFGSNGTRAIKSPGNISFAYAQNIAFKHNVFSHLSSAALDFDNGSQDNTVENNRFDDISGSAIQLGNVDWGFWKDPDTRKFVSNNLIIDNYITKIGQQYHDSQAIFVGYADHTRIVHNEISDIPYSGIVLVGGGTTISPSSDNITQSNKIYNFMNLLNDGGGIYTMGLQPKSVISKNYIYNQYNSNINGGGGSSYCVSYGCPDEGSWYISGGAIYPDEGSSGFTISNNVVINNAHNWLFVWNSEIYNNVVEDNFSNTDNLFYDSYEIIPTGAKISKNTLQNNRVISLSALSAEAQDIIKTAGIQPTANQDVKNSPISERPNLALNVLSTASSSYSSEYLPARANDGVIDNSPGNGWFSNIGDSSPWWQVDLGKASTLRTVELTTRRFYDRPLTRQNFEIRVSNDPTFATYTVIYTQGSTPLRFNSTLKVDVADSNAYRYVRIAKTKNEYFSISEVKVN
jgi:F5/8 type C domain/Right handed beta helix region